MHETVFYKPAQSPTLSFAAEFLSREGFRFAEVPSPDIGCVLLPVPTPPEWVDRLPSVLEALPHVTHIFGGDLPSLPGHPVHDLLLEPTYTAQNAYITACCALRIVLTHRPVLRGCPILVIGWGRIGKCLSALLRALDAQVTVAARKESDRAMAAALGYAVCPTEHLSGDGFDIILNTVPAMLLPHPPKESLKIELASQDGIGGEDVVYARRLPGQYAPRDNGTLIGQTVLALCRREGLV